MIKKYLTLIILGIFMCPCISSENGPATILNLEAGWKFKTGDDLNWAAKDLNDSSWSDILPGRNWEDQGFEDYNGFAWYRVKFHLPLVLKKNSSFKDSLVIFLGKIDDNDQTYLNGRLIGQNNKTIDRSISDVKDELSGSNFNWNIPRKYVLSTNDSLLRWDEENVLAIRVYDQGGPGGIFTDKQQIRMLDIEDYIHININLSTFAIKDRGEFSRSFVITNSSSSLLNT